jgi:sulfur-carrier protein adenylyltransferase/sulfurtransferase
MSSTAFDHATAFSRTVGWVTREELARLRNSRVAIAGLGGVGGIHLMTQTRLGIGAFRIADFDHFDLHNFNRQAGASMHTIGRAKSEVMAEMARAVNPELALEVFPDGVKDDNLDAFLDGVDVYVDGLDFFAVAARRAVFAACTRKGIPAVTAAPLGMGSAVISFLPGRMSFEEYFRLEGQDEAEQLLRFLLGLSPAMLQRAYLVDPSAVDFLRHRGPSTPMACELCAGLAATEVLKILLGRGRVNAAPWGLHFDAYRNRVAHTWRPWGNHNPLQQLTLMLARRQLRSMGIGVKA